MFKYFLLGMAITGIPFSILVVNATREPQVLAEQVTPSPTPSPTSSSTPSPTPTPTSSPKPTPVATPTPSLSPTPTGIPGPTPDVWPPKELEHLFIRFADEYAVDNNYLERLANCESHFNIFAVAPNYDYVGLFQFDSTTWQKYRNLMGQDANTALRTSAEESIKTAAYATSLGDTHLWPRCP